MFPMIATLSEFRAAQALLAQARDEVLAHDGTRVERIETGVMVEIPSAALLAAQFAPEVDFFSIGTNDLTQYTLAAERGNPRLADLADAFQPSVLHLIQQVITAAHAHGKRVNICGELAGDPLAVSLLVGLGVDELSMNAAVIPRIKQIIRALNYPDAAATASRLLVLESPEAIRAALADSKIE
jgi:phosphotransferase system enzyme I (PtsI)